MNKKQLEEKTRLSKPAFPLPRFVKGATVQVYMGAGWSTGEVISSLQDKCAVRLSFGNRVITVYDARSIRPHNTSGKND